MSDTTFYSPNLPQLASNGPDRPVQASAGSISAIIGRIEEAIESETASIKSDPKFDIRSSNARKSRYLYELNRAIKGISVRDFAEIHRDAIVRLKAKLVAKRSRTVIGGFAVNQAKLPAKAQRQLRTLAKQLAGGATVRVTGHTDGSSEDRRYLRELGLSRAKAVRSFLNAHGAKATYTLVTKADTQPRATNATVHGRALNRRVVLEIVR